MSKTLKAIVDCPVCQAPQGHRHTPNCIVVTGLLPSTATEKARQTFSEIVDEFEREFFSK